MPDPAAPPTPPALQNRTALVTGAAQGLGEAIALRLAREGCDVALADVQLEKVRATAGRVAAETGRRTIGLACDVTDEAQVAAMVGETVKAFDRLDVLVANAGILIAHDITEFPAAAWKKVLDVNLYGYFLCAREAARVMAKQKRGVILQINSKSGKKGSFRSSAYAASKFGGIGLTQSIALDLAPHGVRVNAVCPGNLLEGTLWQESLYKQYAAKWGISEEEVRRKYVEQVPLGRGCTYDDVCDVVSFLASDRAGYMTGQAVNVTGGQEMR